MKVNPLSRVLFFAILGISQMLNAQIADNFSDGNFSDSPAWQGSTANFIVNTSGQLQLNAPAAGNSTLAVQGNIADSAVWNLYFKLAFAPSSGNLLRIYLMADQAVLLGANGYYLEIGENGSADAFRFYRQDAGAGTLLATGTPALVAGDPVDLQIRMKRSKNGEWSLSAGAPGGVLSPEFTVNDAAYGGGTDRFFGFYCLYTATRTDKFYFDDVSILPDVPDTQAPVLLSASAQDELHVSAVFNEKLDSLSAVSTANYSLNGGAVQPVSVALQTGKQTVLLSLPSALTTGTHQLQCKAIGDVAGNVSGTQVAEFQYIKIETAEEFDIQINEIMADPAPTHGLPEVEWIELYNRSSKILNLNQLRIDDGGLPQALPDYLLNPGAYVVLASPVSALSLLPVVPNTVGVPGFPSLNNDGDLLSLSNQAGVYINRVNYSIDWHVDLQHKEGGYSLERINPGTPCIGPSNWASSAALTGGTPGAANSVLSTTPDQTPPQLPAAFPSGPTTIVLYFSEGLDRLKAADVSAYQFSPARTVVQAAVNADARNEVTLTLLEPMLSGQVYEITVGPMVVDCSGNPVETGASVLVGLPEAPEFQDIVINEILFNPVSFGARYVELYNRSNKVFSWQNFYLANNYKVTDVAQIGVERLIFPGDYHVFTTNPKDIATRFPNNIQPKNIMELSGPTYGDIATLVLYWVDNNGQAVIVDSLTYSDEWHNALYSVSDREGVALERIRADLPANNPANWTSASDVVTGGAGTPTLPNSQRLEGGVAKADDLLFLERERLSPDDDGYEDFLPIQYKLPESGYAATLTIYNSEGNPVRRLARQELIGTEGNLRWDGESDEGTRVRPGIYILYFEVFRPDGTVKKEKKTASVVRRF